MRLIVECMGKRREFHLREGASVVGRDASCDIAFPDPSLSRRHLECTLEGGQILVRDLHTKNGTFLGSQRIEEARLPPGVPLRAGNVWLRFEAEERDETLAAPGQPGDLESRVPASENFEQDEEPTPGVDELSPATGAAEPGPAPGGAAEEDARVVVRDNRWYLRDAETGSEVEIVPLQKSGGPPAGPEAESAPVAPGAQLPARILRREGALPAATAVRAGGPGKFGALWADPKRRIRLIIIALAALIVLLVAGAALFRTPKPIPLLSRAQYRKLADQAVEKFRTDPAAALAELAALQNRPAEGNFRLAQMLQEAFEADIAARTNFQKGYEAAQAKWEEVRKSSESTDAAVKLAQERSDWFLNQVADLVYLSAAREAFKDGDYPKVISNAANLDKAGQYGKEAEELIQKATDALSKVATTAAAQMRWTDAVSQLRELIKARPDLADSLQPKIAEYEENEAQRLSLEDATRLFKEVKYDEARPILQQISQAGPYAKQAAAMLAQIRQSDVIKMAQKAYDSGLGDRAVDMLAKAGLPADFPLLGRIRAVMAAKAKANEALQAGHYEQAKAAWQDILRLESPQTNAYAREAKGALDNMPATLKAGARKLVDKADLAAEKRDYLAARNDYQEALRLDSGSQEAKDGLARLAKSARLDFNVALAAPRDTLGEVNEVLQMLQSVRDRIAPEDKIYSQVDEEINDAQRLKEKLEKPSGPKQP